MRPRVQANRHDAPPPRRGARSGGHVKRTQENIKERYEAALRRIADRDGCGDPACACTGGQEVLCNVGEAQHALGPNA